MIVGAGLVGLGTALRLRELGLDEIVVLERGRPGSGSSSKGAGGFRRQFGSRIDIEMSLASWPFYERMIADPDYDGGFQRVGYAFVADAENIGKLETAHALQREFGIDVGWLHRGDLEDLLPYCDLDGLEGGTFCAEDGFFDTPKVTSWLLRRCRKTAGISVREFSPVDAIEADWRIRAVVSEGRRVLTDVVVNAAGAWAGEVGKLAGEDLPVEPSPRHKPTTERDPAAPADTPLVTDLSTGVYVRYRQGQAIVGVKPTKRVIGFEITDPDPALLSSMVERAAVRFPHLKRARVESCVSGLYENTADGLPLVGPGGTAEGFYVAAAFNGHGLMHSPAATRSLAELIVRGESETLDLRPLRPTRFREQPQDGPRHVQLL